MRKIIVSEFISLDGVFEAPGPDGSGFKHEGWTMSYGNDEFMNFKLGELFAADALLLGRLTYEGFAKAWPHVGGADPFSERMNSLPKYVVSNDLEKAEWNNSHVIKENISQGVAALKEQPGQDILVFGSGMLTQTLMKENLVDEIRLLVYPIVLGSGKKFFGDGERGALELLESRAFATGVVLLRYEPKREL